MTLTREEITRLFRVQKTLMQMLKDRGYFIEDSEITMTQEEFIKKYVDEMDRNDLVSLRFKENDNNDKLYVFFPKDKVEATQMKVYTNGMKSDNVYRAILVMQHIEEFSKLAQSAINTIYPKFHLKVFQHQALTTEEKKTLLERCTVKENQLPRIQVTDPIAK